MDVDDLLEGQSEEDTLQFMEIDLALADIMASWEASDVELSDVDRYLVIQHMRAAYIAGYTEGAVEMKKVYGELAGKAALALARVLPSGE